MNEEENVWEEEIDLREVGRGILRKWPFLVIVPLVVMALVGSYFFLQPDRYEVSVLFDYEKTEAVESTGVQFPSETIVRRRLLSLSVFENLYPRYFNPDGPSTEAAQQVRGELEFSRAEETEEDEDVDRAFELAFTTTDPDSTAQFLNDIVETYVENENQRIREESKRRLEVKEKEKENVRQSYREWREATAASVKTIDQPTDSTQNLKLVERLGEEIGPIPEEVEVLQRNQEYIENIQSIEKDVFWLNQLLEDDLSLYKIYPAEAPGVKIDSNGRRNTVLAGVVTFLLLFFGVAFWEIL